MVSEPAIDPLEVSAHDLIQPLTSIKSQADLLARRLRRDGADREFLLQGLELIAVRAQILADRLDGFLGARRDAASLQLHPERCDLRDVLGETREELDPDDAARVVLRLPDSAMDGEWDPRALARVFRNLVLNALKYGPPDGRVEIELTAGNPEVVVAVRDHGMGITKAELPHLFDRFYRSPRAEKRQLPGTGLGLWGCRALVEALGGKIWAESEGDGKGATFRVALPRD